ncbi:MAG: hypothetical protein ACK4OE_08420 [Acidovorax sp.]|uniref:hypothetical protein n=1 Tax=Acidovorax sp. TaxID=1872122 RepID=UPI00391B1514
MTRRFLKALSRLVAVMAIGVASMTSHANDDVIPVEKYQPPITVQHPPASSMAGTWSGHW